VAHLLMGLGGEDDTDTKARIATHGPISDSDIVDAITVVLRQEAFNHKSLQAVDGRLANGMSVMAMAAHTGCNTVYGSTPANNPHPYPWMNSLFSGRHHRGLASRRELHRRSWPPVGDPGAARRRADATGRRNVINARGVLRVPALQRCRDDRSEILELPEGLGRRRRWWEWATSGYQNTSKVILQNRPNVKAGHVDTQVYSNTGGQNSDSTPMLGGNDMNVFGTPTQGKNDRKENGSRRRSSPDRVRRSSRRCRSPTRRSCNKSVLDGTRVRGTASSSASRRASRTRRQRRHGADAGTARTRLARRAGVRLQPAAGRKAIKKPSTSRATPTSTWIGTNEVQGHERGRTDTRSPTGARRRRVSATI
jgi:pyruvate-ferredoxin/flavodoxin oxidoreductase